MRVLRISGLILMFLFLVIGLSEAQTDLKYYDKGLEYAVQGNFLSAKVEFKKTLDVNKYNYLAEECLKLIDKVLERSIEKEDAIHLFKRKFYLNKGMYDAAIVEAKIPLAIKANVYDADTHFTLGSGYLAKGRIKESIVEGEKAITLDPNNAKAYFLLGLVYMGEQLTIGKKNYEKAIIQFKKTISVNPNFVEAYYLQGVVYSELTKYDEAIVEYKNALAINPNFYGAYYAIGTIYVFKEKYDEAIIELNKALAINPNMDDARLRLGISYFAKHMLDESIVEFKKAVKINPNNSTAHNKLAITLMLKKQYKSAIEHCDKAIELGFKVDPKLLERLKPHRKWKFF